MIENLYPSPDEVNEDLMRVRRALLGKIRRRRRGPVVFGITGIALGAAAGVAAVIIVPAAPDAVQHSVRCFEADSLSANYVDLGTSPATASASGETFAQGRADPQELCSLAWRGGLLGQASLPADPNTSDFPVPALALCRLTSGQAAAFPDAQQRGSAAVCEELGLTRV